MSGSGTSEYDVYFNLADLSLCHLTQDKETDLDDHGTRAYGSISPVSEDDGLRAAWVLQRRPDCTKGWNLFLY